MTACTERQPAAPDNGLAGEGQKGMPGLHSMTACTERQPEGRKGMPEEGMA
jgi:hypothetical protein